MGCGAQNQVFDHEAKTMKEKLINVLLGVSLVVVTAASVVSARLVVTEQDREWAKKVAEQEKTLQTQPVPNSVAILYFNNKTELADLNPIKKGLAIMLITDLAKIEGLQIVERARLEALVGELNLAQKGLTDPAGNARIGRFLRAEHVVGGEMLKGVTSNFKVKSSLLDVSREEVFGNPQTEGKLLSELFKMEKELLFGIIKDLKIKLTPKQKAELQKPLTTNLNALLASFAAIDYSDRGDYSKAEESAQQACAQDPGLCKMMDDIRDEIKVAAAEVEKGQAKDSRETDQSAIQPVADLPPVDDTRDPTDLYAGCIEMGYVSVTTTCGVGACRSTGSTSCVEGKVIDNCVSEAPLNAIDSTCDGIDNNCNGQIDEGYVSMTTTCGVGACSSTASTSCVGGRVIGSCVPKAPLNAIDSTCDGIDDNCNGQIDEGYVSMTTTCGVGACSSTASTSCVGGRIIGSCVPGIPVAEICGDGSDNDCNGAVDEGCSTPPVVSMDSIDTAHSNTFNDSALETRVNNGEFVPGGMVTSAQNTWRYVWTGAYTSGLQTIGADADGQPASFLDPSFLEQINADPYLAYAVQLEEDRINRQILEMHAQAAQGDLLATINNALNAGDIRRRDDLLMQQADAQAGRVLKDREGNWVRTQQYILRPDNQTVQMLNVSLRGNGTHAGLSTIDWTTSFSDPIPVAQSLRDLPWSDYLDTISGDGGRYIGPSSGIYLDSMYVRFTNPSSQYLQESRTFGAGGDGIQPIETEQLTSSQWQGALVYGFGYQVPTSEADGVNPIGFTYVKSLVGDFQSPILASVSFIVLGDANTDTNIGIRSGFEEVYFQNIWDVLRVNETGEFESEAPNIGSNNLEIIISGGMFDSSSIDTVYIPLSRMLWKQSPSAPSAPSAPSGLTVE
jgi:TolB-like protein